jgi:hypothetical protein
MMIIAAATTVTTTTLAAANMLHMLNVKTKVMQGMIGQTGAVCLKIIQKLSEPAYLESVTSSGHGAHS